MSSARIAALSLAVSALAPSLSAQCANGAAPPCAPPRAAPRTARALDPNVIAVIPFRVTGADTALAEGLAEVLAAEFTGEGVPRAADQGAVWRAWRSLGGRPGTPLTQPQALQVAAQVGAGQVLIGSAAQFGGRLVFNASTLNVPSGAVRSRAEPVSDAADSLPSMLRRLTANLLAGSGARAVAGLGKAGTSSAEAMRAYMEGTAANRRGLSAEARRNFSRAVELDSTFALAALGGTVGWGIGPEPMQRLAWSLRGRLSAVDRAVLVAYVGPNYPNVSTMGERIAALETAAAAYPDNEYLLYQLGDHYFHYGVLLGLTDGLDRGNAGFLRSIAADSMLQDPLIHLVDYALMRGDTASVRRYGARILRDTAANNGRVRWQMAVATREATAVDRALQYLERTHSTGTVIAYALWDSTGMANADRLLAAATRTAMTEAERLNARTATSIVDRNRGRPQAAHQAVNGMPDMGPDLDGVYAWLYGDGDSTSALSTLGFLQAIADAPLAVAAPDRLRQYDAMCVVEQWRVWVGETASAQRAIERLSSAAAPADGRVNVEEVHLCATALTALRAVRGKLPGDAAAVAALDSAIWAGENIAPLNTGSRVHNNRARLTMLLTRLHEIRGDTPGALRAVRKRMQFFSYPHSELLAASLREEGRLAALAGDRAGAIKAYRWYLTLVTDPEPALVPRRDHVRAELARLERDR